MKKVDIDIGRKIIIGSLGVNVLQIALILLLIINSGSPENLKSFSVLLYILALSLAINSACSIASLYFIMYNRGEKQGMVDTINQLRELNKTIRAQRHDYLNHIQVVYGLLELKEPEEALKYMEPVYKDIIKVNKALKTSEPAVNALLQAKLAIAEEKHIDMELSITSELKELPITSWELCRILGNILDNSIYALEEIKADKKLYLEINEDMAGFGFSIVNNGPKIPGEIIDDIFKEGFTTKGNKGEGMGLYIVKELLDNYKGKLKVISDAGHTEFNVFLPRNTQ
ncbi:sensor histidine kinase [Alloiococcus sp. CFN-8]|uniref:sensor histidine kinase n=1 Tax=Alloiococcus sp. CFN-8 TaxID=3416081 RepID=UPI003CF6165E